MINSLKIFLFEIRPKITKTELLVIVFFFIAATYLLAPVDWELSSESYKNWVSAQIWKQTGVLPVLHHGALYNLYLQFFLLFDYPLAIQLEHSFTQIFCYSALFLLLKRFLPTIPALLLVSVWIPMLWEIEGGSRILAMGFFSLYLYSFKKSNREFFPLFLLTAALVDTAFIFFLAGHIFGMVFLFFSNIQKADSSNAAIKGIVYFSKFLMLILVCFTLFSSSEREDHNVFAMKSPWNTFQVDEIYSVAFFYVVSENWMAKNFSDEELEYQDLYLNHKDIWGSSQTALQGLINRPDIIFSASISNLPSLFKLPQSFVIGFQPFNKPIFPAWLEAMVSLVTLMFISLCFVMLFKYFRDKNGLPQILSIFLGTSAAVLALLPIFYKPRYVIVLLPVFLICVAHIGFLSQSIVNSFSLSFFKREQNKGIDKVESKLDLRYLKVLGILSALIGLFMNEWVLASWFSSDGSLAIQNRIFIWTFDLISILLGIILIIKPNLIVLGKKKLVERIYDRYSNQQTIFSLVVTLFISTLVFISSINYYQEKSGILNLKTNPFYLRGSLYPYREKLLSSISRESKLLANETSIYWAKTFNYIDIDKSYQGLYLPPFKSEDTQVTNFLKSMDTIWVDEGWTKPEASSTNTYLRYKLHVEPFIKESLLNGSLTEEVLPGWGKIYKKVSTEKKYLK